MNENLLFPFLCIYYCTIMQAVFRSHASDQHRVKPDSRSSKLTQVFDLSEALRERAFDNCFRYRHQRPSSLTQFVSTV
jgi:hypothetical protein